MEADRTALLVMDVQDGVVERLGDPEMLERTATAIAAARSAGVRVIYVQVGFRAGYPEVSSRKRAFSGVVDLIVLRDACADRDEEVHRVLNQKVFPRQALVTTVAEWAAGLGAGD